MISLSLFEGVKQNNRLSRCQSQLKQIALVFQQYALDYDNRLPLTAVASKSAVVATLDKYGSPTGSTPSFGWTDASQPYVKSTSLLYCPNELFGVTNGEYYTDPRNTDYWMNGRVAGASVKTIARPEHVFLHGDGDGRDKDSTARYNKVALPTEKYDDRQPIWTQRHRGGANYSFVDGHVKWLLPEQISAAAGAEYTFSPK
ncbi:MAG TPA: H-X9-DG-CTERM domain-containing protein [Abditibacteriaceae bacterium]|jgi:prepilin-type processing-associated H-X9-DG protein